MLNVNDESDVYELTTSVDGETSPSDLTKTSNPTLNLQVRAQILNLVEDISGSRDEKNTH